MTKIMSLGQKNQVVAGSLHSGKHATSILSLIQPVRNNGHDPYAHLRDVLTRLTTQRANEVKELLPHRWRQPWSRKMGWPDAYILPKELRC
jgi:hypothetical protein